MGSSKIVETTVIYVLVVAFLVVLATNVVPAFTDRLSHMLINAAQAGDQKR
jgi:hypothetical protein